MTNRPKICIPITSVTRDEITETARKFATLPAEMVEWRVDFFAGYERDSCSDERIEGNSWK